MPCSSCSQHREEIKKAVRDRDVGRTVRTTALAVKALGENAGRKLVRAGRFSFK